MRLHRFNNFINESAGSGITFTGACSINVTYEVSSNTLRIRELYATPDKFAVNGPEDGITGASPWLLFADVSDLKGMKREQLKRIKIKEINKEINKKLQLEDGVYGSLGELLKANPDVVVTVKISAKYNYKDTKFAGYVRGKFSNMDVVMETITGISDYSDVFVQGVSADGNEDFIKDFAPKLKGNKRFLEFYDQAFNDQGKKDFVEDETRAKVAAGTFDPELQAFIEEITGYDDYSVDQLKQHIADNDGTLNDFIGYMEDKEMNSDIEADWKKSIESEYTAEHDPSA